MNDLFIVTGADGHLGNTVVRQLAARGERVRGLVLPQSRSGALDGLDVEVCRGDLLSPDSLDPLFAADGSRRIQVIHTAGIVSIASRRQRQVYDVNVTGTRNLLAACRRHGVRRIVYTSSVHAIPEKPKGQTMAEPGCIDPRRVKGLYAQTKALATRLVLGSRAAGLDPVVVFPSGILGPNDYGRGHLTQLVRDYLSGRLAACVDGGYDFVDVRDVADGLLRALELAPSGGTYVLSGHYCTIPHLLEMLHQITGRRPVRACLPLWLAKSTAPLAEAYYQIRRQPPLYTSYSLFTLTANARFSHRKASAQLGYHSRPLEETLRDTVAWLQRHDR